MREYAKLSAAQLKEEGARLNTEYNVMAGKGLKLDLSRGKPDHEQLEMISKGLLDILVSSTDLISEDGTDCGNYGILEGIPEARRLMAGMLDVDPEEVFVGGNSSLNMMHDCLCIAYLHGLPSSPQPWCKLPKVKWLCPSPGYDRHFMVTDHFGIEMIPVPMTATGPDMDVVEALVASDSAIKGMWCIPKFANPTGVTYTAQTVRCLANLRPAAPDFLLFWDNAYSVHDLYPDEPDELPCLMDAMKEAGNPNMALLFTSTSKVTFPGSGIAAMAASQENLEYFLKHFSFQTISYDKLNQLRHARYFGDIAGMRRHMRGHAAYLLPKFEIVNDTLSSRLEGLGIAEWTLPRGGYFISLDIMEGCAKRTVELCRQAGVVLTPAGATFPYGADPLDRNIRLAPTYASLEDAKAAAELLCLCVRLASVEKLLGGKANAISAEIAAC